MEYIITPDISYAVASEANSLPIVGTRYRTYEEAENTVSRLKELYQQMQNEDKELILEKLLEDKQ